MITTPTDQLLDLVNDGKLDVDGFSLEGIVDNAREWMFEGWGIPSQSDMGGEPTLIAAAIFNEAKTQDQCVKDGDSHPDYPKALRWFAHAILKVDGHDPKFTERVDELKKNNLAHWAAILAALSEDGVMK